jgi:predicted Zn-dependent peptidase
MLQRGVQSVRRFVCAGLAALVLFTAPGEAAAAREIVQFRLPNGLDVILERDARLPRVAVLVAYDVGSRDDPPGLEGLAHLVEHLNFRSSRHLPREFAGIRLLQGAGASELNGYTSPDFTAYHSVVPSHALALALYVESERMAFSLETIDAASIRVEQDVVWREQRPRDGSATFELGRTGINLFFGEGHPYYREPADSSALDATRLSHVRAFIQQRYRPDNAHLIVVGNFELESARALVERYFAPIVASSLPAAKRPKALRHSEARSFVLRRSTSIEQLAVYWPVPDPLTEQGLAALLYAGQLARQLDASMAQDTLATRRLGYNLFPLDLGSLFGLRITTRSGDLARAAELLQRELQRNQTANLRRELPNVARSLLLQHKLRRESALEVAKDHLRSTRASGRPFDFERWTSHVEQMPIEHVERAATWFRGDQALIGWLVDADTPSERASPELSVEPR